MRMNTDKDKEKKGSSNYSKVLNTLDKLEEIRLLATDIQEYSDVADCSIGMYIDPLLKELHDKVAKATRFLKDIDWGKIKEK